MRESQQGEKEAAADRRPPPLALAFTANAVVLLAHLEGVWEALDEAPLDTDGQARGVDALRRAAARVGAGPAASEANSSEAADRGGTEAILWLPSDHLVSLRPTLPKGPRPARLRAALAAVAAATGQAESELAVAVMDPTGNDGTSQVHAAFLQTVREARAYAEGWGFTPTGVTAMPADRTIAGAAKNGGDGFGPLLEPVAVQTPPGRGAGPPPLRQGAGSPQGSAETGAAPRRDTAREPLRPASDEAVAAGATPGAGPGAGIAAPPGAGPARDPARRHAAGWRPGLGAIAVAAVAIGATAAILFLDRPLPSDAPTTAEVGDTATVAEAPEREGDAPDEAGPKSVEAKPGGDTDDPDTAAAENPTEEAVEESSVAETAEAKTAGDGSHDAEARYVEVPGAEAPDAEAPDAEAPAAEPQVDGTQFASQPEAPLGIRAPAAPTVPDIALGGSGVARLEPARPSGGSGVATVLPTAPAPPAAAPALLPPSREALPNPRVAEALPTGALPVEAEPALTERSPVEPPPAEPALAEPTEEEPSPAQPSEAEPALAAASPAEPVVSEPVLAEPGRAEAPAPVLAPSGDAAPEDSGIAIAQDAAGEGSTVAGVEDGLDAALIDAATESVALGDPALDPSERTAVGSPAPGAPQPPAETVSAPDAIILAVQETPTAAAPRPQPSTPAPEFLLQGRSETARPLPEELPTAGLLSSLGPTGQHEARGLPETTITSLDRLALLPPAEAALDLGLLPPAVEPLAPEQAELDASWLAPETLTEADWPRPRPAQPEPLPDEAPAVAEGEATSEPDPQEAGESESVAGAVAPDAPTGQERGGQEEVGQEDADLIGEFAAAAAPTPRGRPSTVPPPATASLLRLGAETEAAGPRRSAVPIPADGSGGRTSTGSGGVQSSSLARLELPDALSPRLPSSVGRASIDGVLPLDSIALIGVLDLDTGRQALLRLPDGRYRRLGIGGEVSGWEVTSIALDRIRLSREGDGDRTLALIAP